jgi:hypothetical protein
MSEETGRKCDVCRCWDGVPCEVKFTAPSDDCQRNLDLCERCQKRMIRYIVKGCTPPKKRK